MMDVLRSTKKIEWRDYQIEYLEWAKTTCKENRVGFIKMLLGNLTIEGIRNVQTIVSRIIKKKKYSNEQTRETILDTEDAWWELPNTNRMMNWAGYTEEYVLIAYIKILLTTYRYEEVRAVRSSYTYRAREQILHPERPVSRRKSVPGLELQGWWSKYDMCDIVAVDCEMIAKKVGKKVNGAPRCKNYARSVSVVCTDGSVLFKKFIKHNPEEVHLTPMIKKITGFNLKDMHNGEDLDTIRKELHGLFQNKLLIFIGAGSDFDGLKMERGEFDVFDLHQHYEKDSGKIGLRSLVKHFYGVDIQMGIHDPDIDAKYTMKIFLEQYIPDKLKHPDEVNTRYTTRMFNEIATVK